MYISICQELLKICLEKEEIHVRKFSKWYAKIIRLYGDVFLKIFDLFLNYIEDEEKIASLTAFRFFELSKQLPLLCLLINMTAYHQAIREMRYILESFIQAYHLDDNHPDIGIKCKVEIIKEAERELYGVKLIDKLQVKRKNMLKNLYFELSKHVHSSYKGEWKHVSKRGAVEQKFLFEIDEKLLEISAQFMVRVFDAILYLLIKKFPAIIKGLKDDLIKEMRELGMNMVTSLLEASNPNIVHS